jgi:hypothetical protein
MLINKEKSIRVYKNNCIGRWKPFECKKKYLCNTVITNIPTWLIMNMILF